MMNKLKPIFNLTYEGFGLNQAIHFLPLIWDWVSLRKDMHTSISTATSSSSYGGTPHTNSSPIPTASQHPYIYQLKMGNTEK